jgi:hypothetical protein
VLPVRLTPGWFTANRPAPMESVDGWPLAIAISDALGGMLAYQYPLFSLRRDWRRVTSSCGGHARVGEAFH